MANNWLDRAVCAFDIETVPDAQYGRTFMGLEGTDFVVQEAMQAFQLEKTEGRTDFLPVHLHQVVALSVAWWVPGSNQIKISSLGEGVDEHSIIGTFARDLIAAYPRLVSWNGGKFDLPVLHYRWMKHRVAAPHYWKSPDKWNTYQNRYHDMHVDVMEVLGGFRNNIGLDDSAQLMGFPGKVVTEGHRVFQHIDRGELDVVQGYCEMDAFNTLLMYVRLCVTRGELSLTEEQQFWEQAAQYLNQQDRPGWSEVAQHMAAMAG